MALLERGAAIEGLGTFGRSGSSMGKPEVWCSDINGDEVFGD